MVQYRPGTQTANRNGKLAPAARRRTKTMIDGMVEKNCGGGKSQGACEGRLYREGASLGRRRRPPGVPHSPVAVLR